MVKKLEFKPPAFRQWLKLPKDIRNRVEGKLIEFVSTGKGDVRHLRGRPGARLRVGDWRVLFVVDGDTITVIAVGHWRDVYE